MKVKALMLFSDLEAKKLRKNGEIFDVSEKRAVELSSAHNGTLIEVIGDEAKEEKKECIINKKSTRKK